MTDPFVIIAEQDWNLRNVLRQSLDGLGFQCLVTPTAAEAEDFAAHVAACLVLLDVELPGFGGYDACARIRHRPSYARIPIVLMTGTDHPRRRAAARRAGASAMLVKPFSVNDLMREVAPLLGPDAPAAARDAGGAALATGRAWGTAPPADWRAGEGSAGRRALEVARLATRRP